MARDLDADDAQLVGQVQQSCDLEAADAEDRGDLDSSTRGRSAGARQQQRGPASMARAIRVTS